MENVDYFFNKFCHYIFEAQNMRSMDAGGSPSVAVLYCGFQCDLIRTAHMTASCCHFNTPRIQGYRGEFAHCGISLPPGFVNRNSVSISSWVRAFSFAVFTSQVAAFPCIHPSAIEKVFIISKTVEKITASGEIHSSNFRYLDEGSLSKLRRQIHGYGRHW